MSELEDPNTIISEYNDPSTWRLKTSGDWQVPYRIVSASGSFGPEEATASMSLLIPADRLIDFAKTMFPPMKITPTGILYYPSRGRIVGTPLQAKSIAWGEHVDGTPVDPFGLDATAPEGTYQSVCAVSVEFGTLDNQGDDEDGTDDPGVFLTITCNGAGEYITSEGVKDPESYESDSSASGSGADNAEEDDDDVQISIMVPQFEWSAKWPRIPIDYFKERIRPRLRAAIGRVNSEAMPLFGVDDAETMLFVGFSSSADFSWRSTHGEFIQIDMRFVEKNVGTDDTGAAIGHNHFWKPGAGWTRALANGTNPVYPFYDLNLIYT